MSTEENKAVVHRCWDAINKHNLAGVFEDCAPDYVMHGAGVWPDMDLASAKQLTTAFWAAFPDMHVVVEDLIAEGDKVVSRYTFGATHWGELMGIPPTGKVVTATAILISRFAGGKCVEDWEEADMLGLFQQLGVIPQMAQGRA